MDREKALKKERFYYELGEGLLELFVLVLCFDMVGMYLYILGGQEVFLVFWLLFSLLVVLAFFWASIKTEQYHKYLQSC